MLLWYKTKQGLRCRGPCLAFLSPLPSDNGVMVHAQETFGEKRMQPVINDSIGKCILNSSLENSFHVYLYTYMNFF